MNELLEKDLTPGAGAGTGETAPEEAGDPRPEPAAAAETPVEASPEDPEASAPEAPEAPGTGTAGPGPEAAPEPGKTVFAASPWERRKEEKTRRREEKASREEWLREEKARKEAALLEKRLEKEARESRQEERRREEKARREEARQAAREERAQRKRVRRVGTMTLGVALIAIGAAILAFMLDPGFDLRLVAYLAPVILISLGLEVLIRYLFSRDHSYQYDLLSGFICLMLVLGSFAVAALPHVMYYISPQRFAAEDSFLRAEEDKLYLAFQGDQRVKGYYVNGGISAGGPYAQGEDGSWTYGGLDYLQVQVNLLTGCAGEEEFAQTCRELLDRMEAQGVGAEAGTYYLSFSAPENEEGVRFSLDLDNPLQREMDAQHLLELVDPIYSQPTLENGWYPGNYEEIAGAFGEYYADEFALVLENYGETEAGIYYAVLFQDGEAAADAYYGYLLESGDGTTEAAPAAGEAEEVAGSEAPPPPVEEADPALATEEAMEETPASSETVSRLPAAEEAAAETAAG